MFGCHISIREGYYGAAKKVHDIGASAFQYFPKNPWSLSIKDFDKADAKRAKEFIEKIILFQYPIPLIQL
ncbi:hypothetical protein RZN22_19150 [Bacillaceae bacterium S4-13-58]